MNANSPHVCVCICTYRRPDMLRRLLISLCHLRIDGAFTISIVVADNDSKESARGVVKEVADTRGMDVVYCVEERRNIALVRNKALRYASGEFIAFIDDDEFPDTEWLLRLYQCCVRFNASGVLGPVLPYYASEPPAWVRKGGFHDRPRHHTGFALDWKECRTGSVLIRRAVFDELDPPFSEEFGSGGEDQDFFRRAIGKGHLFLWCDEAEAHEEVPPARWSVRIMIERALLRGRNTWRHQGGRWVSLVKSIVAVPVYLFCLPFSLIVGFHLFLKLLVRCTDHVGKLLAVVGMNPMQTRDA